MNSTLRNTLVVIAATVAGFMLNSYIIQLGFLAAPLPEGVNPQDLQSIKDNIHLYTVSNFINPFIAHAAGSLIAGLIIGLFAYSHQLKLALIPGVLYLIGGISMVVMIPNTPIWFILTDLLFAYIPVALQGAFLGSKLNRVKR